MASGADRIVEYVIAGTRADSPAFVSVSRTVSVRVVCVQLIDAATATPCQEERRPLLPRRLPLPAAIATLAVPVAAASIALAAAPLLRRLPARLLPPGALARQRPMLPRSVERAAPIGRPPGPLSLEAGWPVPAAEGEESSSPLDEAIPVAMAGADGGLPATERELVAAAGAPS